MIITGLLMNIAFLILIIISEAYGNKKEREHEERLEKIIKRIEKEKKEKELIQKRKEQKIEKDIIILENLEKIKKRLGIK